MRVLIASIAVFALLALVFLALPPMDLRPAGNSADSVSLDKNLPDETDKAHHGSKPSPFQVLDNRSQREPDVTVELKLPESWGEAVSVLVTIEPRGGELEVRSVELTLGGDEDDRVAIYVPKEGATMQVSGTRIVPMHGELRWMSDRTLQFLSWLQVREQDPSLVNDSKFGSDVVAGRPHPAIVVRSPELHKGSEYSLPLLPLVPVRVSLRDQAGIEFDMPRSASHFVANWSLPRETGAIHTYQGHSLQQRSVSEICWHVPAGANLVVSVESTFEPSTKRLTVPAAPDGVRLEFTARDATLGRVRVISAGDGRPLPDAQFQVVSVVREAATEPGVFSLLMQELPGQQGTANTIDVWAPGHLMEVIRKDAVPRDGTSLEVALRPALPALVVRVDFDDGEEAPSVTIHVRVHFPQNGRDSNWRWSVELPSDGQLIVYGDPPRVPFAQPQADGYEFELLERGIEDGLPLRRFKARRQAGLRIRAVNAEGMDWGESVLVIISHALPTPVYDPSSPLETRNDGTGGSFLVSEELFVPLKPGRWTVTMLSPKPTFLFGQESVELKDGIVELEIAPSARRTWRELTILDYTGECYGAGTGFFSGAGSLAALRSRLESEQSHVERRQRLGIAPDDWFMSRAVGHAIAHHDGLVFTPSWLTGTVLVMPPGGGAFFQGFVNHEAGTVEVRVPEWGVRATFAPVEDADAAQRAALDEPGWFVAIREFRDVQDLHRVAGEDYKVLAASGTATIASLPPGAYVAYYVRAREEIVKDPVTGSESRQVKMEWFDQVKFEARDDAVQVQLPVTRR